MAKVKHNPSVPQFSGSIRELDYYERKGKHFVRPKGHRDPSLPWSPKQLSRQGGFKDAVAYAKGVKADPEQKAVYEAVAGAENRDAYHKALSDALNKPVVLTINASAYTGAAGQSISIQAKDDFEVVRVQVSVRDPAGSVLEEGSAKLASKKSSEWIYETTVPASEGLAAVVLVVTVSDRPKNTVVAQIDHLLRRKVQT